MLNQYSRTQLIFGPEAMEKLRRSRVAVFGVGGVGGYVVEALARSGVGELDLVDDDSVALSNLNRQIIATHATLGMDKVEAAAERVRSIDPSIRVNLHKTFFLPETEDQFDFTQYDYVVDAIDTVAGKLALAVKAQKAGTPIISAMGAGNKLDPTAIRVSDLSRTSVDPLARVMRKELKKRGVRKLTVAWSAEAPIEPLADLPGDGQPDGAGHTKRQTPGSNPFVPAAMGLAMAARVVKDLTGFDPGSRRKGTE